MTNKEFIESITLEGEEWRDIPNFEGFYIASSLGRIASLGRYVNTKNNYQKWNNPKLLSLKHISKCGYLTVNLSRFNKQHLMLVHRIIATTFLPNNNNKPCIDHIDTNRTNNNINNLRWCTYSENMCNDITAEKMQNIYKNDTRPKYTREVVALKNGKVIKIYPSIKSVEQDGHSSDNVFQVCKGFRHHHHKYEWMYLSDYETLVSKSKND